MMIRTQINGILGLILLLAQGSCLLHSTENISQSGFETVLQIDGDFIIGQKGKLLLPDNAFSQTINFPNDIRLLGEDETQWPFFLYVPNDKTEKLIPKILNRSYVSGKEPYLQFDLLIPPIHGSQPIHNWLELTTTGHNYIRRVELSIANKEQPTAQIESGYLIDDSRHRNANNKVIRYPMTDINRVRVRIYTNAKSPTENIELKGVRLQYLRENPEYKQTVKFDMLDIPTREQLEYAKTYLLDIGYANRPTEFITFEVENSSYVRSVSIYGSNDVNEQWKWVGGGEIHALEGNEKNTLRFINKKRFLKIHVFYYDDLPLEIKSINLGALPRFLVFEATTKGKSSLCFGNSKIKTARYDLKNRVTEDEFQKLPIHHTLPDDSTQYIQKNRWQKYSKLLSSIIIIAVSLLVVRVIITMLRRQEIEKDL